MKMRAIFYQFGFLAFISSSIASTLMRNVTMVTTDVTMVTTDVTTIPPSTTRPPSYTEDLADFSRNSSTSKKSNVTGFCKEVIHQDQITSKEGRNIITVCLTRDADIAKGGAVLNETSNDFGNPRTDGLRIMQEFLEESGIRMKCILPLEQEGEEYNEDEIIYAYYAYSPTEEMHGIRAKNMFMQATMNRLYEIKANMTRVSGVKISWYHVGWPSRGILKDSMALWITFFSIAAAGVLGVGSFKGLKWWKSRNVPGEESVCDSSTKKSTPQKSGGKN